MTIAKDFEHNWQFPNCGGAIDGKHVRIIPPQHTGSYYFNYKGTFSIVLLALVNANLEFCMIDVGTNGRVSDGGVLLATEFYKRLQQNKLDLPSAEMTTANLNFVFVADEAFALHPHLMKPYSRKDLTYERKIFNYRLSRARRVVENAFGILANRFRIFHTAINLSVDKVENVVMACCVLHNFLRRNCRTNYSPANTLEREDTENGSIILGEWRNDQRFMHELNNTGRILGSEEARECRNTYTEYFTGRGSVEWQDRMI